MTPLFINILYKMGQVFGGTFQKLIKILYYFSAKIHLNIFYETQVSNAEYQTFKVRWSNILQSKDRLI